MDFTLHRKVCDFNLIKCLYLVNISASIQLGCQCLTSREPHHTSLFIYSHEEKQSLSNGWIFFCVFMFEKFGRHQKAHKQFLLLVENKVLTTSLPTWTPSHHWVQHSSYL